MYYDCISHFVSLIFYISCSDVNDISYFQPVEDFTSKNEF